MPRILQFTDLHMRAALPGHSGHLERRSRHVPELLELLRTRIETEAPDLVALTGDILDVPHDLLHGTGDPAFRAQLEAAARTDYRMVRNWLDSLGRPWLVATGNHDVPEAFRDVFGDASQRIDLPGLTAVSYYDWEVRDNTAERLGAEAARFAETLERAGAGWTVHLQHYLIRPQVDFGYPMLYREADEMLAQLEEARGDHLSLSGHYHFGSEVVRHGPTRFAVCPAMAEAPHPYRVFDLKADGTVSMRQKTLVGALPGRRALCIDRTALLTGEPEGQTEAYAFARDLSAFFAELRTCGLSPVLVSAWNDPQSRTARWADIMKRHDRAFGALGTGADHGAAQAICIDEALPAPTNLPSEPISSYASLRRRVAEALAIPERDVLFVSASPDRRARFGETGAFATVGEALAATGEAAQ